MPLTSEQKTRRTQQERSEEARAKLLAAAIALINDKGMAQVTMADVAAKAGFTRGAIQHHFAGRDELVLAVIHDVERKIIAAFDAVALESALDLGARVDQIIDALGAISVTPAYLAVVDIWLAAHFHQPLDGEVRMSMLRSSASFKRLWMRLFGGEVAPPVIADCRRIVVTLMRGMVVSQVLISNSSFNKQVLETAKVMVRRHMVERR